MDLKLLAVINLNYFVTYLAYSIYPPYLPKVAGDRKGLDQQTVGLIMSLWYVGYAIFAVSMSHILRVLGRKNAICLGFILIAADFMMNSLWNKIDNKVLFTLAYWVIRFVHGGSQAFIQVTTYSIIGTWFKDCIAKVVGIVEFSWGCGIALGPIIAEILYNLGGFNLLLYVFSGVMLLFSLLTFLLMTKNVEGTDTEANEVVQSTDSSVNDANLDENPTSLKSKISICWLFRYKLFVFGILASFFNLTFYTLLEPILSNRLTDLGVQEKNLGEYFFIQPFVYSFVWIFLDKLILAKISKRLWLIVGFGFFVLAFIFTGPSMIVFLKPSIPLICFGLVLMGIASALSFVPIFPELIESVFEDFKDRTEDLNNTAASLMNASYGSAAFGEL